MFPLTIGYETLQIPDAYSIALFTDDTDSFTLVLLGTDPPANSGQGISFPYLADGLGELSLLDMEDKGRDIDHNRAPAYAGGLFALQTSLRLLHGNLRRQPQRDFLEISPPDFRRLFRHALPRYLFLFVFFFRHTILPT
jgi:hypothetical protein